MLDRFLKDVIIYVAGKQAEEIAELIHAKTYVNEFNLAKKLDLTINQTRNILYKISDQGLVSSIRKKDKKKGWYTYFWKIEVLKSLEFLKRILVNRREQVINQIKSRETREFYICERCNIEFNQENALLYDFTCNECGEIFILKDNTKVLRELKKNLTRIQNELNLVETEIDKENAKLDKEKIKVLKKIEAEKKVLRLKRAVERKIAKKKVVEKVVKKKLLKKKKIKKKVAKKIKKKTAKKKITKKKIVKKKVIKKVTKKKSKIKLSKKKSPKKKIVKKKIKKKISKKKRKK